MIVQARQQLHGHVLERQGRAVEQLQQPQTPLQLLQRGDGGVSEAGVGVLRHVPERGLVDLVAGEAPEHVGGHGRIVHAGIGSQLVRRQLGPDLGDVEAAVGGQAFQDDVEEAGGRRAASRGDVTHQLDRLRRSMAR